MGKNIIITGTSRGIGFELVKELQGQGHRIFALSRNCSPLEDLGLDNVTAISCDLADSQSIQKTVKNIREQINSLDILIHNAGYLVNKPFEELQEEDVAYSYKVNVQSVFTLTRLLMPIIEAGSHILGITTMGGVQGSSKFPGLAAYSSSKASVITLFELLAEEYKDKEVSFNTLALGAVQTEMLQEAFPGFEAQMKPETMASYIAGFALTGHKFYNGKCLQVSNSTP